MKMSIVYLILYIATYSVVVPLTSCFLARKKKDKVINTLGVLLGIDLIIALIIEYCGLYRIAAYVYFNIYTLFAFMLVSLIYTRLIPHWKKWIYILIPAYTLFFIVNNFWIDDIKT